MEPATIKLINIVHRCGHREDHMVGEPHGFRIAALKKSRCAACHTARRIKNLEVLIGAFKGCTNFSDCQVAVLRIAHDIRRYSDNADLVIIGSDKQIQWAQKIYYQKTRQILDFLKNIDEPEKQKDFEARFALARGKEQIHSILQICVYTMAIFLQEDAGWWISVHDKMLEQIFPMIVQEYKDLFAAYLYANNCVETCLVTMIPPSVDLI